jgi:hypothetical protein
LASAHAASHAASVQRVVSASTARPSGDAVSAAARRLAGGHAAALATPAILKNVLRLNPSWVTSDGVVAPRIKLPKRRARPHPG